ncbi:MAG: DUF99 family protein [Candidatus Hydrothermarchaeales archaeon]
MDEVKFREIKGEIRVLGIDDAPFKFKSREKVPLVGTVFRGGEYIEGVLKTEITSDGNDATERIAQMINSSRHREQIRVMMLDGITVGGFNIIDLKKLFDETHIPIIVVTRRLPDLGSVMSAIENFEDKDEKLRALNSAGEIHEVKLDSGKVFIHACGIGLEDAKKVIRLSVKRGLIPEPIRVAHLIASAMVKGESKGRA